MCLSTVYKDSVKEENIIMKNVMSIEYLKDKILLIDLMERKLEISLKLKKLNLVDGIIIVEAGDNIGN